MIKLKKSKIQGCFELLPNKFGDNRGSFVKTFHKPTFEELGLCTDFQEEYYSVFKKNAVRGMHFQTPRHDHVKLAYCTAGKVLDVVLDIRKGSPTYGQCASFELCAEKANMVYIPKGMAHGFCVLPDEVTMLYKVSTIYTSEHDAGIAWDMIGFDWSIGEPIVSDRDTKLGGLDRFVSPFLGGDYA